MRYTLPRGAELSPTLTLKIIKNFKAERGELLDLGAYYRGVHKILRRENEDPTKPNHKIVNPFPQYITDTLTGYFVGEPIVYTSTDEALAEELQAVNTYNGTASVDTDLARTQSIYGLAYEFHYVDESGSPCFVKQDPQNIIAVYDDSVKDELLYIIRLIPQYDIEKGKAFFDVEVYDSEKCKKYRSNEQLSALDFVEEVPHIYGEVPFAVYKNNEDELGDFENIIPLIDAYDVLESDALNDFDYFVNCYMVLSGMTADADDVAKMKENRVIVLGDGASANWLVKSENDTVSEHLKDRYKSDIHKFAKVPDLSDEAFSNNASGVAMRYKLFGTETVTANKERYFREGLGRRFELLCNVLNAKSAGVPADWRSIDAQFTRNLPTNDSEIADLVQKLQGIVSSETLLSQLPFITDVNGELERLEEEQERNPFYDLGKELEVND